MAVDEAGNIHVTGAVYSFDMYGDSYPTSYITAKFDTDGRILWIAT